MAKSSPSPVPKMYVLSLTLAAVGELGPEQAVPGDRPDGVAMDLHVGGLRAPREDGDHVVAHWLEESPIHVGDEIVIRVKEAQTADPSARRSSMPQLEDTERDAFDAARETYFRLRHKYQADLDVAR